MLAILELVDQLLLPPLAFTSVITGLVLSFGTPWGLLNHFWIVAKLVVSIVIILTGAIVVRAAVHAAMSVAAQPEFASSGGSPGGNVAALLLGLYAGHLLLLGIATALTIYKPFGLTPRGRNRARLARAVTRASSVASRAPAAAASASTTRIVTAPAGYRALVAAAE